MCIGNMVVAMQRGKALTFEYAQQKPDVTRTFVLPNRQARNGDGSEDDCKSRLADIDGDS